MGLPEEGDDLGIGDGELSLAPPTGDDAIARRSTGTGISTAGSVAPPSDGIPEETGWTPFVSPSTRIHRFLWHTVSLHIIVGVVEPRCYKGAS